MPRVIHFEILAEDPERVAKFYTEVFSWQIQKWEGPVDYWLVKTGEENQPGIDGGIMKQEDPQSGAINAINSIDVPDVDEFCEKIVASGGEVEVPKFAIPGVGYMAYCKDTAGNSFSITQLDPSVQ